MLKVTKLTGAMACGKSHTLRLINDALIANGRPVIYADGQSSPAGIRQEIASKLKPVRATGWRRFFGRKTPVQGPVTILMDDAHSSFIKNLQHALRNDPDVYLITATYGS